MRLASSAANSKDRATAGTTSSVCGWASSRLAWVSSTVGLGASGGSSEGGWKPTAVASDPPGRPGSGISPASTTSGSCTPSCACGAGPAHHAATAANATTSPPFAGLAQSFMCALLVFASFRTAGGPGRPVLS